MSKVYMIDFRSKGKSDNMTNKLKKLLKKLNPEDVFKEHNFIAIKMHFGEQGKDTFIRPIFVKPITDILKDLNTRPYLTDTNTLYSGKRKNGIDHLTTAYSHGFLPQVTGVPVVIGDGIKGSSYHDVTINQKHFEKCHIADSIYDANGMVALSHFKGHDMAGFGGAIKNLAMGCAPPAGKKDQHSTQQKVNKEKCIACGNCKDVCPENAIILNPKADIDNELCIGCGECMTVCPTDAIYLNWKTELQEFNERMVEYAYAAVKDRPTLYINFLNNITPDCDCTPWSDAAIVEDIGILASTDPVAIDQASHDLVHQAKVNEDSLIGDKERKDDLFKTLYPNTIGEVQLSYGEKIGLGSRDYDLIKL
jgi:uncharacterized Fe-S center protein